VNELLSIFGISIASALIPLINIELILAGLATQTGLGATLGLAIAAGSGQTIGKVVWWFAAEKSMESRWVQKKLDKPKWQDAYADWSRRIHERPWYAALVIFVSSAGGIPPLLVLAIVAGSLKMPLWAFVPTVWVGRVLRFWLILAGVSFALG
jgi:membrane protein YqaA with SNARE-associated domain